MATDTPMRRWSERVLLNGFHFHDPVTDYLKNGTTEVWRWVNLTVDAHPMHPHLFGMQVVNRQKIDVDGYTAAWNTYIEAGRDPSLKPRLKDYLVGDPIPPAPEELGYKDTVKAPPGIRDPHHRELHAAVDGQAKLRLKATNSYGSWVYHCHILEHEENDMMRPFVVVK